MNISNPADPLYLSILDDLSTNQNVANHEIECVENQSVANHELDHTLFFYVVIAIVVFFVISVVFSVRNSYNREKEYLND